MSAYDNPTIIKDDSAMAWAQATGGFAESFKQSFDVAKKDREAKGVIAYKLHKKDFLKDFSKEEVADQIKSNKYC